MHYHIKTIILAGLALLLAATAPAQSAKGGKKISEHLFGLFFEDINYAADGGLYAELVQNRSFEYSPTDNRLWNPFSFWEYVTPGYSYGKVSVETAVPVHLNNPHYMVIEIEHIGHQPQKFKGIPGVGLKNSGFAGIVVRQGDRYNFSMFARQLSDNPVPVLIRLEDPEGNTLGETSFTISTEAWTKYPAVIEASGSHDAAKLLVLATGEGKLALDMVSLFPEKTFKRRANGLRQDLAQVLGDLKPNFMRFPGGCMMHGDGVGNMYRWKNTIGPIEQRVAQKNYWGYHQTAGLGFFEYFQFCEDIGAMPLPVLPAAVSCQGSGGTWPLGGVSQEALPMSEMKEYVQEVLDLIEWANGPVTSTWGAKRAEAGHPAPFNLKYVGIGNEDKMTPEFEERFQMIYDAVRTTYPEIVLIGNVGNRSGGPDYEKGWKLANQWQLPMVDEHYYEQPDWFIRNQNRYDNYKRGAVDVYIGEFASSGNKLRNAIAEAVYMTALERNGDVVKMASYAPLLAKKGFTQWTTDMIFFDNTQIYFTPNYHVQKLFLHNSGDYYFDHVIAKDEEDKTLATSCVRDSKSADIILKIANYGDKEKTVTIDLKQFGRIASQAKLIVMKGDADALNSFEEPNNIIPVESTLKIKKVFDYTVPPMSVSVIRVKK